MAGTVVLGASGLVGGSLLKPLAATGTSLHPREGLAAVDATDEGALRRGLAELRPQVVVNCVGLADVDRAEREPDLADQLNRLVVENLTRVRSELGFRLVHISTDYVFDGARGHYSEDDPTGPVNEYGRSKLRGEQVLPTDALVLRISSPFGETARSSKVQFYRYVSDSLRAGRSVRALTDQRVTATYLPDLAEAISKLLELRRAGVYHVGGPVSYSRYEFARTVAELLGAEAGLVVPATRREMTQWSAPRPADTSLDVRRSTADGVQYTPLREALSRLLTENR